MSDRYQGFVSSPIGKLLVKNLGLPNPTPLERWTEGAPLVDGVVVLGGSGRLGEVIPTTLDGLGIASATTLEGDTRAKALVFDATGITDTAGLVALQEFFTPLMRRLETCPRVLVLGTPPETTSGSERVAQRALEGFTRSLGKEAGRGSTLQLVYVSPGAEGELDSTLRFLLSPRSASTSPPRTRRSGSPRTSPTASTSSSTTPASPKTGRSRRCRKSAGRS